VNNRRKKKRKEK